MTTLQRPVVKREADQRDNTQLAYILPVQQILYFLRRFTRATLMYNTECCGGHVTEQRTRTALSVVGGWLQI